MTAIGGTFYEDREAAPMHRAWTVGMFSACGGYLPGKVLPNPWHGKGDLEAEGM